MANDLLIMRGPAEADEIVLSHMGWPGKGLDYWPT